MKAPIRLVIAGGGTGGHVFPGIAVADALARSRRLTVLWIGTGRPVETDALKGRGWEHRILPVRPIAGTNPLAMLRALVGLPIHMARAVLWLRSFSPHVALGVGGYVSGPVILAARLLGIPTAIHEQNAVPGLANRMAARAADLVFVSFPETGPHFSEKKVIHTGNPVRASILAARTGTGHQDAGRPFKILVLGGSQGAAALNRLAASAMENLWRSGVSLEVVHQTGTVNQEEIEGMYRTSKVPARVIPFITDIHNYYAWADLVICRAGAGTIFEITALGKPAILIPYPHAAGGHQDANAAGLAAAGAALFFQEDRIGAVRLAGEIQGLAEDKERLLAMGRRAARFGKPDSADEIARHLLSLAEALRSPPATKEGEKRLHNNDIKGKEAKDHV